MLISIPSSLYHEWLRLWLWLRGENASRATVILVFITAWYAFLTHRMAKAMNRQTRAMIQPIISMDFVVEKDEPYPKGRFTVKNLGSQPMLLLDMRLQCRRENILIFETYNMYERHILPPDDQIAFNFDFTERYTKKGVLWWSPGCCTFYLEVVVSDLAEEIILTYGNSAYWGILTMKNGMPLRVRWKFFSSFITQRYYRVLYKFKPQTFDSTPNNLPKRKERFRAFLHKISNLLNRGANRGKRKRSRREPR